MKPVGASRLLPIFDDVNLKAVFSVSVARPREARVLSNMPLKNSRDTCVIHAVNYTAVPLRLYAQRLLSLFGKTWRKRAACSLLLFFFFIVTKFSCLLSCFSVFSSRSRPSRRGNNRFAISPSQDRTIGRSTLSRTPRCCRLTTWPSWWETSSRWTRRKRRLITRR